jgi:hypothetical protein
MILAGLNEDESQSNPDAELLRDSNEEISATTLNIEE